MRGSLTTSAHALASLALTLGLTLGLGLGLTLGLERRDDGPPASGEECAQRVRGDAPRDAA